MTCSLNPRRRTSTLALLATLITTSATVEAEQSLYAVDQEQIFKRAVAAALKVSPQQDPDQLGALDTDLHVFCSNRKNWRLVDPATLEIPEQKESTTLCHMTLNLIDGPSIHTEIQDRSTQNGEEHCQTSVDWQGFVVTVFANGDTTALPTSGSGSYGRACAKPPQFQTVDEIIAEYRQKAPPP